MNLGRIFWGLVFLIAGLVLLGVNLGWLPAEVWSRLWTFWPLILVFIGARLLWRYWRGDREEDVLEQAGRRLETAMEEAHERLDSASEWQGRGGSLVGGAVVLLLGLAMLGATAGWWDWAAVGAAPLIGVGIGLILREFIR